MYNVWFDSAKANVPGSPQETWNRRKFASARTEEDIKRLRNSGDRVPIVDQPAEYRGYYRTLEIAIEVKDAPGCLSSRKGMRGTAYQELYYPTNGSIGVRHKLEFGVVLSNGLRAGEIK
jgi:hypothetical protein